MNFKPINLILSGMLIILIYLSTIVYSINAISSDNITCTTSIRQENIIYFPDKNLENGIRESIEKPQGDIYLEDVKNIKSLRVFNKDISNLEGIQHLESLEKLYLTDNEIKDISPISGLINLKCLHVEGNNIVSLESLRNLKKLEHLRLSRNNIKDLKGLSLLTNLKILDLYNNEIVDVDELGGLEKLRSLDISHNKISDISILRKMTNLSLSAIRFEGNPLPDYLYEDSLKERFILSVIRPYIHDAIEEYYGVGKQYMNERILEFTKLGGEYRIKVKLETFTGAHNPPYGVDTMTVIKDFKEFRVQDFEHEEVPPPWNTYSSEEYHVMFKYPTDWKKNPKYMEKYEGENGYFLINAVAGGSGWKYMPIDEVVKFSTEHKLKPYGSNPQVENLKIRSQEARLIIGSSDQPEAMKNQAELIIKYPGPVFINSHIYHYFVLIADKDHIMKIAKTLKFINYFE